MSGALAAPPPGLGAAAGAGPMPPDPTASGDDTDTGDDNVLVTICKNGDGSYTVYAGDEPDDDSGDMSDDDADAMGPAGGAPAPAGGMGMGAPGGGAGSPQGVPADSIGAALKAALDILNGDKSSEGAPGNADDQFAGGFNASKSPTPATGMPQKF